MKDTTLVIMAAGIGSRFGGGIKQLEPVGPHGEIIMDYSIHDAMEAGFNKVIFIIRRDLEKDFREIIGNRIERRVAVEYAFQELHDIPERFIGKWKRKKPWGTGQALISLKGIVNGPFVVINADDYYGKEAFIKLYQYLTGDGKEVGEKRGKSEFCMAGFILANTLSENGGVTRGICRVNEDGELEGVEETYEIKQGDSGIWGINYNRDSVRLDSEALVSMNMWGFWPGIIEELEEGFDKFLENLEEMDIKKEYLLPQIIDGLLKSGRAKVKVLKTKDKWFGVTYKEDKAAVADAIQDLIKNHVYDEAGLYSGEILFGRQ